MIKFILKTFKFLFTLFVAFIIFAYIFSVKSNLSFEDTITYFQNLAFDFFNIENSQTDLKNPNTNTSMELINTKYAGTISEIPRYTYPYTKPHT